MDQRVREALLGALALVLAVTPAVAEDFAWDPPTTNSNGQPFDPNLITEYRMYNFGKLFTIIKGPADHYRSTNLKAGSYSLTLRAVGPTRLESGDSNVLLYDKQPTSPPEALRFP